MCGGVVTSPSPPLPGPLMLHRERVFLFSIQERKREGNSCIEEVRRQRESAV